MKKSKMIINRYSQVTKNCMVLIIILGIYMIIPYNAIASLYLNNQSGEKGSTVTFDVLLDSAPNKIASLGFDVKYDPNILYFKGYSEGSISSSFDFFNVNKTTTGNLRIGGFVTVPNEIAVGKSGHVLSLTFEVRETHESEVRITGLKDDIKTWNVNPGHLKTTQDDEEGNGKTDQDTHPVSIGDNIEDGNSYPEYNQSHMIRQSNSNYVSGSLTANVNNRTEALTTFRKNTSGNLSSVSTQSIESVKRYDVTDAPMRSRSVSLKNDNMIEPMRIADEPMHKSSNMNVLQVIPGADDQNNDAISNHTNTAHEYTPVSVESHKQVSSAYSSYSRIIHVWYLLTGTMIVLSLIHMTMIGASVLPGAKAALNIMKIGSRRYIGAL